MTTFVFLIEPAYGHVTPSLAIARGLIDRGHRVIYYLPADFHAAALATGADVRTYQPRPMTLIDAAAARYIDDYHWVLAQTVERVAADAPDVVVYDSLSPWSILAARAVGAPSVSVRSTYALNKHTGLFAPLADLPPIVQSQLAALLSRANGSIGDACARYGLPQLTIADLLADTAALNIICVPRQFQPGGDTFDGRFVFVGPCIPPRHEPTDFSFDDLDARRPLVYVSLGTSFSDNRALTNVCFEAFEGTDYQVVVARATLCDHAQSVTAPANFVLSARVPQLEILARACVFVTCAGTNSTMESIYYGVPFVALPRLPQQTVTARRIAELGLGVTLDRAGVSVAALRAAVANVVGDEQLLARTRAMQRAARAAGGYRRAADALATFAAAQTGHSTARSR